MRTLLAVSVLAACSNDPLYVHPPADTPFFDADADAIAMTSLQLPIAVETPLDASARAMRTAELGVEVPYVKVGDIEVSVEWRITNLTDEDGEALVQLNGANEFFAYDPATLAIGLDEDEPQPPGLDGDVPLHIPAAGTMTGLFREDQLREASIDIDQITRGNVNPFRATLTVSKNATQFEEYTVQTYDANGEPEPQSTTGVVYPREAFAQIVRVDIVFRPDRLMRFQDAVRVRDNRGIMHDMLEAAPADELQMFMPAVYTPAAPP
jgi:hypothetical protein